MTPKIFLALILSTAMAAHADSNSTANNLVGGEACAIQTCGEAPSLPFFSVPITTQDETQYKNEIEPLISKYIQKELMLHDLMIFLIKKFAKAQPTTVSDNARALMNFFKVMTYLEVAHIVLKVGNNSYKVDTSALKHGLLARGINDEIDWLVETLRVVVESPAYFEYLRWRDQPLEYILVYEYPGKNYSEALVLDAKKSALVHQKLSNLLPVLSSLMNKGGLELLQKILASKPIDSTEKELYLSLRGQSTLLRELLEGGTWRAQLLSRKTSVAADISKVYENAIGLRKFKYQSWNPYILMERSAVENRCKASLTAALASSPTSAQNENFKKQIIPQVKSAASAILSSEEKQILNKTEFILPKTRQDMAHYFKHELLSTMEVNDKSYQLFLRLDPNLQTHQEAFYLILSMAKDHKIYDALEGVGEFCDENGPKHIVDSALASFKMIHVGWRSVLYPNHGFGTLAHEVGHVLSAAAKENPRINNIKSCLQKNQNGIERFVEEDFADLFASKVMTQQKAPANYACLLLRQTNQKFSHLNFSTLLDDKHSSSFLRLLNLGSYMKTTAPACESLQKSLYGFTQWQDCWL